MDFASWLQNRKPAPEVVAVIEVAGHLLGVHDATNNFRYRVSEGSNYEAALKFLAEDPERCYQLLQEMDDESVSNSVGAICLSKLAENSFDGDILFEKGGDEIRLLGEHCVNILLKLDQNTGFKRRPVLKQHTVGVLVDGSRASYLAMNLAARLRGYGRLVVLHAHDPAAPALGGGGGGGSDEDEEEEEEDEGGGADFLARDIKKICAHSYGIPQKDFKVVFETVKQGQTVNGLLEDMIIRERVEVVVVGSHGQAGPRVAAHGRTCARALALPRLPTVAVNTHAQHLVLAPPQREFTFLLAVGVPAGARQARGIAWQALSLLRPGDRLLVLHIAAPKLLGPAAAAGAEEGRPRPPSSRGGGGGGGGGGGAPRPAARSSSMVNEKYYATGRRDQRGSAMVAAPQLSRAASVATAFEGNAVEEVLSAAAAAAAHHRAPAEMELQKSETRGEEEDEEDFVQRMMQQISDCIEEAQAPGETITIEKFKTKTIAEHICEAVEKHSVDFLMVKHGGSQTVSMECARAARCPVVLLKPEARHPYDDGGVDGSEGSVVG